MKTHKLSVVFLVGILAIPIAIVVCMALVWLLIFGVNWLSPNPPEPQITNGEFPFELVYTFEGETVTVKDVYVCEYVGIGVNEGEGKYLEWKGYIKSSGEEHLVVGTKENQKIVCYVGSPSYYMNDPKYIEIYDIQELVPEFAVITQYGTVISNRSLSQEELNEYKIQVNHWQCSSPIQNTFE